MAFESPKQLWNQEEQKIPLFEEQPNVVPVDDAKDSALTEITLTGNPNEFDERVRNNLSELGSYEGSTGEWVFEEIHKQTKAGVFDASTTLLDTLDGFKDNKDKIRYFNEVLDHTDNNRYSDRLVTSLITMQIEGEGSLGFDTPMAVTDAFMTNQGAKVEIMRDHLHQEDVMELRKIVNDIKADVSWANGSMGAATDVVLQEIVPIQNVLTKSLLMSKMSEMLGLETTGAASRLNPDLAIKAENIRTQFSKLSQGEKVAALNSLREELIVLRKDPLWNKIFRQYNVVEQTERLFTDELLLSNNPVSISDRWWGTFEVTAETIASAFLLGRVYKGGKAGIRGILGSQDTVGVSRAARTTGNRAQQAELENLLQGKQGEELGVPVGESAASQMPRPALFVDERGVHTPGLAAEIVREDTLVGEITKATAGRLHRSFTNQEKLNIADAEIAKLQLGDHARVAPAMSTIDDVGDGVLINAVITRNGVSPYGGFNELLSDVLILDPNLENLTILRRGDDGNLHNVVMTPHEVARLATNNVEGMTDAALFKRIKEADPESIEFLQIERELTRRTGDASVSAVLDDEFFLQYNHFRAYHPTDKIAFGADSIRHTSMPLGILDPNARFGEDIAGAFIGGAPQEARIVRLFNDLQKPFYDLNSKSKRRVASVFEWAEDEAGVLGKDPDIYRIMSEFPDLTEKELRGWMAVRRGMDMQFDIMDRRLYLEFNGLGYKTAQSVDPMLPRFHGDNLELANVSGKTFYNPVTQEQVKLTTAELTQLYADGGSIMKLDIAIDIAGSNGLRKSTMVLLDGENYKVGKLSNSPLERYPGYRYRFQEDPYNIIKTTRGVEVDGKVSAATAETTEALKTAGSQLEAEAFLDRIFTRSISAKGISRWFDKSGNEYSFQRAKDITQTDSSLAQKEVLHRQGRLFWGRRQRDALTNVNGNTSEIMDFTRALEQGTAMQVRMNGQEDMLRTLKHGLLNEFNHLPEMKGLNASTHDISEIIAQLEKGLLSKAAANPTVKASYKRAMSLAKYVRQLEGIDSPIVPWVRGQLLRASVWMDGLIGGKPGSLAKLEKGALNVDPLQRMKSIAFGVFMVFRPLKQFVLQASQPLFLAGIDPIYVVSGRGAMDALALRMGFGKLRHANYVNDGYNPAILSKAMGLTKREYKTLVKKLDESGTIDVVDVHSFNGGTRKWNQMAPHDGSASGRAVYGVKKTGSVVYNGLKSVGFDMGESFNKLGTFNVAWRRVMKEKGYRSLLELTDDDWRKVNLDTESLSFSMTRPGSFGYQHGALSVTTQFLSFTHKMGLALLNQNPALKGKDVARIYAGLFTMFGANMFGARDLVKQQMFNMGLDETFMGQEIPGAGFTVIDLLSAGIIQNVFNRVGEMTSDSWKELDTETVGPIFNGTQFAQMQYEGLTERPIGTAFGPFGNRASKFLQGLETADLLEVGLGDMPVEDRLLYMLHQISLDFMPQYRDTTLAYLWAKTGKLKTASGNSLIIEPAWNAVIAKGAFGVSSMEETAGWQMNDIIFNENEVTRDLITAGQRALRTYMGFWRDGEIDHAAFNDRARFVGELGRLAPEGRRQEVIKGIMTGVGFGDDPNDTLAQMLAENVIGTPNLTAAEAKRLMTTIEMPEELRETINQWLEESYDERILNDEEIQKLTITSNPNLRD